MNYSRSSRSGGSAFFEDSLGQRRPGPRWRICSRERFISDSPTQELECTYAIGDHEAVDAFLRGNRAVLSILREAPAALGAAFGPKATKALRLVEDDEGTRTLFCFVAFDGPLSDAMSALKSLDENWWLDRCGQVAGKLNFDFELV